jgi:arabinofuranosyltransferase
LRIRDRRGVRLPDVAVFCLLAAVGSNKTFLQWMTSGLEAALFNLSMVSWVVLAFRSPQRRTVPWLAAWSAAAAIVALTRPDGLLVVAATVSTAALRLVRRQHRIGQVVLGLAPLLLVVVHLLWRRSFYGEWLPNTYFAKVAESWPEAGVRYLSCFAFEHGTWLWLLIAILWSVVELLRGGFVRLKEHIPAVAAVTMVVMHVGYYAVRVGGDKFEYRILSYLIPLTMLSGVAMVARILAGKWPATAAAVLLGVEGSVGWVHVMLTETRPAPHYDPLAAHVPSWLEPLARWYDRRRCWLMAHQLCVRILHYMPLAALEAAVPERRRVRLPADDIPVAACLPSACWVGPCRTTRSSTPSA